MAKDDKTPNATDTRPSVAEQMQRQPQQPQDDKGQPVTMGEREQARQRQERRKQQKDHKEGEGTELVKVHVPQAFRLVDGRGRQFQVGVHHELLPRWVAEHDYAVANGVTILGDADGDAELQTAPPSPGHPPMAGQPLETAFAGQPLGQAHGYPGGGTIAYPHPNDQVAAQLPIGPYDGSHALDAALVHPDDVREIGSLRDDRRDVAKERQEFRAGIEARTRAAAGPGGPTNQDEAEEHLQAQQRLVEKAQQEREKPDREAAQGGEKAKDRNDPRA